MFPFEVFFISNYCRFFSLWINLVETSLTKSGISTSWPKGLVFSSDVAFWFLKAEWSSVLWLLLIDVNRQQYIFILWLFDVQISSLNFLCYPRYHYTHGAASCSWITVDDYSVIRLFSYTFPVLNCTSRVSKIHSNKDRRTRCTNVSFSVLLSTFAFLHL